MNVTGRVSPMGCEPIACATVSHSRWRLAAAVTDKAAAVGLVTCLDIKVLPVHARASVAAHKHLEP